MYKLLVPVDGSTHSLKALHIACDLADKYKATIALLYIVDRLRPAREILNLAISNKFDNALKIQLVSASEKELLPVRLDILQEVGFEVLRIAESRADRLNIKTQVLSIMVGDPAESILSTQRMIAASTIVMGSRGVDSNGSTYIGSVSHIVFAEAECTCISVK